MGLVLFYHLTRSTVEDTARLLLGKSLGAGWRVMVRGTDPARLEVLDRKLWLGQDDIFLPHGLTGDANDADQPVLLGVGAIGNGASCLMLVDGAGVEVGDIAALERVWILFDGTDQDALAQARSQWKALTGAGISAQYWSEAGGRWEMKAER